MADPSRPRRPVRIARDTVERVGRSAWPMRSPAVRRDPAVSVVVVSYSTRLLTARLLTTLHRVLPTSSIARIVAVDNGSDDGSLDILRALDAEGLVDLVENRRLPYHGPGLNRGVSHLARLQRSGGAHTDVVWVLDSDAAVLHRDALDRGLRALAEPGTVMVGQHQDYDQRRPRLASYAHPASLMFDPAVVWRHRVPAFLEDGAPAVMMQHVLARRGHRVGDVRFFDEGLVLHLGSGTLGALVADGRRDNRYHRWALEHRDHHFHGVVDGPSHLARLEARFDDEVPRLSPEAVVAACHRSERWVL